MNFEEIIERLEQLIKLTSPEDMDEASWGYETGILLTGNEAKTIVENARSKQRIKEAIDKFCYLSESKWTDARVKEFLTEELGLEKTQC